jgi:hypothetical protein
MSVYRGLPLPLPLPLPLLLMLCLMGDERYSARRLTLDDTKVRTA